jgi:hypothetical protein
MPDPVAIPETVTLPGQLVFDLVAELDWLSEWAWTQLAGPYDDRRWFGPRQHRGADVLPGLPRRHAQRGVLPARLRAGERPALSSDGGTKPRACSRVGWRDGGALPSEGGRRLIGFERGPGGEPNARALAAPPGPVLNSAARERAGRGCASTQTRAAWLPIILLSARKATLRQGLTPLALPIERDGGSTPRVGRARCSGSWPSKASSFTASAEAAAGRGDSR